MNVCEIYTSVQGEGPNTGKPTTFLRFGGCNLRCPGWGEGTLPDGTVVPGCDTTFAVYPEWRDTWESQTVDDILRGIPDTPRRVCLTGGEPLIQRTRDLNELATRLLGRGYQIDVFTNGSQLIAGYLWHLDRDVTIVMDWKLPGSGEGNSFDVNNLPRLYPKDALKFVIKDEDDFDVACAHVEWAIARGVLNCQIWFGPVWGLDVDLLISWIQSTAWSRNWEPRLNVQLHKYLWDAEERRR